MPSNTKSTLIIGGLVLTSVVLTLYTISAYDVAPYAFDNGGTRLMWRSSPSGSFLPWPKRSGNFEAISEGNEVDLFVYRYLIRSWILVAIDVLLWVATTLYLIRTFQKQN